MILPKEWENNINNRTVVVWGTGMDAPATVSLIYPVEIDFFVSRDWREKSEFMDKEVFGKDCLNKQKHFVVIGSTSCSSEIAAELLEIGFTKNEDFAFVLPRYSILINYKQRIVILSRFISQKDKSVIDLGAGDMYLKSLLPEGVSYFPVDNTKHSENTILCDFNSKNFPDINADVAFISNTLEFIEHPEWLLYEASKHVSKIILSYNTVQNNSVDINNESRCENAWINDLTNEEIIECLHKNGFILDKDSSIEQSESFYCFLKATPEVLNRNYFCPGCGACTNSCPTSALCMKPDTDGILRPSLEPDGVSDTNTCKRCMVCTKACTTISPIKNENYTQPKCYELIAKDYDVLYQSTSGGAFTLMAKKILREGGTVCGVAWRKDFSVEHILIDDESELHKIQKSKYMQSDVGYIYKRIKDLLESGRMVLFSGCPCHVAGLRAFLKKQYDCLYMVDLLCAQAPPASFFKKYIRDTFGENEVQDYEFRHKTKDLIWNSTTHAIHLSDGTLSVRQFAEDPYQRVYHNRTMCPKACDWCRYSLAPRPADVTIGDFWWIEKNDKSVDPEYNKGISAVLVNNEKGQMLLKGIEADCRILKEVPASWLLGNGRVFKDRHYKSICYFNYKRDMFFKLVRKQSFPKAVDAITNKRFDIGLVGWWWGGNYGSLLTYYALHHILLSWGYSILMIHNALRYPRRVKISDATNMMVFAKKHYIYTTQCHYDDLSQYNDLCGMFITGSDQMWNYKVPFVNDDLFLNFTNDDKKKIAYGSSFGQEKHNPPDSVRDRYSLLIQRYDAVSVREDYAVDIAENIYGKDAEYVLDPVLLLDIDEYNILAEESTFRNEGDFLVAYILDATEEKRDVIYKIARRLNLDVIVIPDLAKTLSLDITVHGKAKRIFVNATVLEQISPEDFLYIYSNCKYAVTDSFHGTCFSYIFKKNFSVFYNKLRGTDRIESLMRLIKLDVRKIDESDTENITDEMLQPIDFSYAECQIERMREKSLVWLKNALESIT
ncbi:MAG: polysaccharide pyruvyl transferase family protein [Oscillospiraceae bacterium]|nr:polysaccharide pyruvyl transferase family protein [Oscillospiraceae bacterium]